MEKLPADSPQRTGRQSQLIRRKADLQVRIKALQDQFTRRQSKVHSKFYQKVHGVVDQYAKAHKLTVVVNYNSELCNPAKPTDVAREFNQPDRLARRGDRHHADHRQETGAGTGGGGGEETKPAGRREAGRRQDNGGRERSVPETPHRRGDASSPAVPSPVVTPPLVPVVTPPLVPATAVRSKTCHSGTINSGTPTRLPRRLRRSPLRSTPSTARLRPSADQVGPGDRRRRGHRRKPGHAESRPRSTNAQGQERKVATGQAGGKEGAEADLGGQARREEGHGGLLHDQGRLSGRALRNPACSARCSPRWPR